MTNISFLCLNPLCLERCAKIGKKTCMKMLLQISSKNSIFPSLKNNNKNMVFFYILHLELISYKEVHSSR